MRLSPGRPPKLSPVQGRELAKVLLMLALLDAMTEIRANRKNLRACITTIVTSQLPVGSWHDAIGDPTLADAILDRLVHNAHRLELKGKESLRKTKALGPRAASQP